MSTHVYSTQMKAAQRHMEGLHCRQGDFLSFSSLLSVLELQQSVTAARQGQHQQQTNASSISAPPLVWLRPDASIADACAMLRQHRLLSVPVYDEQERRLLGMADILDICKYLCWGSVRFFEKEEEEEKQKGTMVNELAKKMTETAMRTLLEKTKEERHQTTIIKRQLDSVCSLMDLMAGGLHRVLVRVWPELEDDEAEGRMYLDHYRILSQVDMVRFLAEHRRNLNHHLLQSTVADLGIAGPVLPHRQEDSSKAEGVHQSTAVRALLYSVDEGQTALDAFRKLALADVHAIGIIGTGVVGSGERQQSSITEDAPNGRLLYNLSASDLRVITPETVHLLQLPVEVFLSQVEASDPTRPKDLVTCRPEATLIEVMDIVLQSGVHRLWVTDEQGKPVGLITLTDILSKFASFDYSRTHAAKKAIVSLTHST